MTVEMGGHHYRCRDCGQSFWVYHGCRNRACPAGHGRQMREWLEARHAELLPCDYYHIVATVPEEIRHRFLSDQKLMYSRFMKTVAGAVIDLARDRKYLGATPGILMVLHTWTGQMHYHPHVHLLVTGGGVSDDGQSWCEPPGTFLVPVKALSKLIVAMDDTHVTFKHKQRDTGEWKGCRLPGVEFLRRFLMHVLPKGFHKLRYYGLWHHSKRPLQERARQRLSLLAPARPAECLLIADAAAEANRLSKGEDATEEGFSPACPHCGSRRVEHLQERCRGPSP